MRRSDVLPSVSPRFVVLRLAIPIVASAFVPPRDPTPTAGLELSGLATPRQFAIGDDRNSQVPGEPLCLCRVLRPRRDRTQQATTLPPARPPHWNHGEDSHDEEDFGAQSLGLSTRCLRFARRVTHGGRKTRCSLLANSTRRDWLPAGFLRKVSGMFHYMPSPFPRFRLAQGSSSLF